MRALGADVHGVDTSAEHAMTLTFSYDGDLKELADYVEDVRGAEVLSLGRSLEIIKDLGDAETVAADYRSTSSSGRTRSGTRAWPPSPTWTSPTPIPTGPIPSRTWPSCTTGS